MATVNRISMPSGRALLLIVVSNLLGDVLKGAVVINLSYNTHQFFGLSI